MQNKLIMSKVNFSKIESYQHTDLRWCQSLFLRDNNYKGVKAVKYDYKTCKPKDVHIWFSNDFRMIYCSSEK